MKSIAGEPGKIFKNNIATVKECLHYTMTLPVSTVCSGIDTLDILKENIEIAKSFAPLNEEQLTALLERTLAYSADGKYENYKKTVF